jgi:hypothetical protein
MTCLRGSSRQQAWLRFTSIYHAGLDFLLINNQLQTFSQTEATPIVKMADMPQGVFDF